MGSTQGTTRPWRRRTRDGDPMDMAALRRIAMSARLILPWLILAALPGPGVVAAEVVEDDGSVIAFCRPLEVEGQPAASPLCICSVEQVECALTAGEFMRHIAALRAAGALGAAEFAAAASQERQVCGPAMASFADAQSRHGRAPGSRAAGLAAHARRVGQP
jgi:hypothetical protein